MPKRAGQVTILGMEMEKNQRKIKDRIGVVLDGGCFYDELTMDEMKSIIAPAYSKWSEKDFQGYMIRFSLNPRQKIATLSKGMRAKFALALALSHHAELLIMDEPTSGLDPLVRSHSGNLGRLYATGARLFSTHITSDLKRPPICLSSSTSSILFQKIRIRFLNTPDGEGDVKSLDKAVEKLFLGIKTTDFGFPALQAVSGRQGNHADAQGRPLSRISCYRIPRRSAMTLHLIKKDFLLAKIHLGYDGLVTVPLLLVVTRS